jgi:hypothetical protein
MGLPNGVSAMPSWPTQWLWTVESSTIAAAIEGDQVSNRDCHRKHLPSKVAPPGCYPIVTFASPNLNIQN